jgi:GT2 family glycosyltransferase
MIPDVTVLMTTRDRADLLRSTLSALGRQRVSGLNWELIVVDNGSRDQTSAVLARAGAELPLTVLLEPRPGKAVALNTAFPHVRAPLVLLTDDDVDPCVDWIRTYVDASTRWPDHRVFGGPIQPLFPPHAPQWLREHPYIAPAFARFMPALPEGPMTLLPFGPNTAVRRQVLGSLRLSPEIGPRGRSYPMGTDTELVRRILKAGEQVIYVPSAFVGHRVRTEQLRTAWLMQRAFNLGRGVPRQAQLGSDVGEPVPRRTAWRRLVHAGLQYVAAWPRGPRLRYERGARFHYWRGYLYEQRRVWREERRASAE